MRTETINIYKFSELSDKAKKVAINQCADYNVSHNWWDFQYEDAENIGLKITAFELDYNRHCEGEFINTAEDVAEAIIQNHGEDYGTRKTAQTFLDKFKVLDMEQSAARRGETEDDVETIEGKIEDLEKEFLDSLLEEYSLLLQNEYEYQTSEAAIVEMIEANEYEFTEDGKRYKN